MAKKIIRSENKDITSGRKFSEKKQDTGKNKKSSLFNRSREESRPSDFDENKKSGTARTSETRPPFKKSYSKPTPQSSSHFGEDKQNFVDRTSATKPPFKKSYSKPTAGFNKRRSDAKKSDSALASTPREDDGMIRLNKYLSNAGICSRREADTLITSGVVKVNGSVVTELGYKIKPTDIVNYGGQTLKKERPVYLILNKPKDYITTADDPQERKTVLHLIQGACRERIYPVGRLDRNTTGLLLFTNDGELTKKLTHPRYGVKKTYHVELDHPLKNTQLTEISEGIELEDGPIKVDEIAYVGNGADKTQVGVEIHSGKNRIVRRIFEHFGYKVKKLDRVTFGPLTKKDLPRGRWRLLTDAEIGMLKMISIKD
jgi:23S rRNA pseudouridine2605 synthase